MSSDHPGDDGQEERGVAVDAVAALGTTLSRLDGRVATLADRAGQGPLLVAVVERRCPTSRVAMERLSGCGARLAVVSQGRPEAAARLRDDWSVDEEVLLVEPAPHPVSDALAARRVPTFVLVEGLDLVAWQDGWDETAMRGMVARAGGQLGGDREADDHRAPHPSRLDGDPGEQADLEAADAALGRTAR